MFGLNRSKNIRISAVIMGLLMLSVMLFSAFYIAIESDHNCQGEDCAICYRISTCKNILNSLGGVAAAIGFAAVMFYALRLIILSCAEASPITTLISLKVELLN